MKHIYVATSKIHGLGLRAGENIKKGEIIRPITGEIKFFVPKNKKDSLSNPNWIGVDINTWIDPDEPYKFINHSCDPNSGIRGKTDVVAIKDIAEGEEITIDYSTIECDERWEMECNCGSKKCRKKIRSIQFLPRKVFESYLPYINTVFQKVYLNKNKNNNVNKKI